jgi:hypothetical protein
MLINLFNITKHYIQDYKKISTTLEMIKKIYIKK